MIKAILFDCDGVLMDTERLANEINVELLNESGIELSYDDCRRYLTGKTGDGVRLWLEERFQIRIHNWEDRQEEWSRRFRESFSETKPLMPGAVAMFEQLDLPVAVVSNSGLDELHYKFETTGLDRFIPSQLRFSGQQLNMPKPEPGAYLKAASDLGFEPEHCVVIEDSVIGARAGINAGMRVWGFTADADEESLMDAGVHQCFEHLSQLDSLIRNING